MCPMLISYRAGKPFAVDKFNTEQRILSGTLPNDAITARVAAGTLTVVETDYGARWSEKQQRFDSSPIANKPSSTQAKAP